MRIGRRLLKLWAVLAAVYVAAAIGVSVAPLRAALSAPPRPAVSAPPASTARARRAPPGLVEVAVRQAAIVAAPPLLLLWFGWDVWFAVVGFFGPEPEPTGEEA